VRKLIHLTESVGIELGPNAEEIKFNTMKLMESKGGIVIPQIEAIHAKITRNCTFYGPARMKGKSDYVFKETGEVRPTGVFSWTAPFNKPMLVNHNLEVDPLGRIIKSEYRQKSSTGVPCTVIYPKITDPEAVAKVIDGRYNTVSIGVDTEDAFCSICNKSVMECGDHKRGLMYEKKLCFWAVGNFWGQECSFVNAPSDTDAGVKDIPEFNESSLVQLGLLIQDLREHKLYDLNNDEVYALTSNGLAKIPRSEYIQEYYYIPFNIKVEEEVKPEIKPGNDNSRPTGKMKTGNQKQAYYGHNLLHSYARKNNANWTKDKIESEHARVVGIILNKSWNHSMIDGLDKTLPDDLQKRSKKKEDT
jgi:hypothetical protein